MKPFNLPRLPQQQQRQAHAMASGLVALLLAGAAGAQTAAPAPPGAPAEPKLLPEPAIQAMETTRQGTRDATDWLARRVDSWFGDRPFEQGGKVTEGRLALELFHRSDQKTRLDLRFSASSSCPMWSAMPTSSSAATTRGR